MAEWTQDQISEAGASLLRMNSKLRAVELSMVQKYGVSIYDSRASYKIPPAMKKRFREIAKKISNIEKEVMQSINHFGMEDLE